MLTIIAEIKVKPGSKHLQHVINSFKEITPTVFEEDGCFGYELLINHESHASYQAPLKNTVVMLEKWKSIKHLDSHLATVHMKEHHFKIKDDVLGVDIRILENGF